MPDKPKKRKRPPTRYYEARGVFLDVDPDKIDIYREYKRILGIGLPDPLVAGEGSWKKVDRQYFLDHFDQTTYVRLVDDEEREVIFETMQRGGQAVQKPDNKKDPLFKYVLVANVSPGCRLKLSVDRLTRKVSTIAVFAGMRAAPFAPPAAIFQTVEDYMGVTGAFWTQALQAYDLNKKTS